METISFALGVASVLVVLLSAVTIWLTFRVKKITTEQNNLHILINNVEQYLGKKFDDCDRHSYENFRELNSIINSKNDELVHTILNQFNESKSYTDSRIDKLIDVYFEHNSNRSKTKQIING